MELRGLSHAGPVGQGKHSSAEDSREAHLPRLGTADPALEVERVHRSRSNTDLISSSWAEIPSNFACIALISARRAFTCAGVRFITQGLPSGGTGIPRAPA